MGLLVGFLNTPSRGLGDEQAVFSATQNALVLIETAEKTGSGALVDMKGAVWVLTHDRAFRGGAPIRVRRLNGERLSPRGMIVSERDGLVAIRIEEAVEDVLSLAEGSPLIDDEVFVLGSPDGQGVLQAMEGRIEGVGPEQLALGARFDAAAGGSPVVNRLGDFLGVAVAIREPLDPETWIRRGGALPSPRSAALRLDGRSWQRADPKVYFEQMDLLVDLAHFCERYRRLRLTREAMDDGAYRYSNREERQGYRRYAGLSRLLDEACRVWNAEKQKESVVAEWLREEREGSMEERAAARMAYLRAQKEDVSRLRRFSDIPGQLASLIGRTEWVSSAQRAEADFWLEVAEAITRKGAEAEGRR